MSNRILLGAVLFGCAFAIQGQQNMFKIELAPSGAMVSLNQPTLVGQTYVFQAWPDGASTTLPQTVVKKITQLTGKSTDTVYQIDLNPSGLALARDIPILKNGMFVFHTWRAGVLTSVRKSDVRRIGALTGKQAFWAEQAQLGEVNIGGNFAMEGTDKVISIGTPPGGGAQAGPNSMGSLGQSNYPGISGASSQGNWLYEGTPGVSDAWAPANATVDSRGGVPRMPAATDGSNPPRERP